MTRTVTALYDSRSEAESACERLTSSFETCSTSIIDQNSADDSGAESGSSLSNLYVSEDDRDAYGEGVRRGGFMLCAEVSSDEDADQIIQVLEQTPAVDMDRRQQDWRNEGWQPSSMSADQTGSDSSSSTSSGLDSQSSARNLGTRQSDRGGSNVRSYARDTQGDSQTTTGASGGMSDTDRDTSR